MMRFDDMVWAAGVWESSGSEHSAEETSLFDMVNSFMERDLYEDHGQGWFEVERNDEVLDGDAKNQDEVRLNWETTDEVELRRLTCIVKESAKGSLLAEVIEAKRALEESGSFSSFSSGSLSEFSRQLMSNLRARGHDAGLCKSRWQRAGSIPAGAYEYIDIISGNTRYIVELSLADHFSIARPTSHYTTLIQTLPEIFIGTVEEMKQVVKVMCKGMKMSMGSRNMKVPPWRKHEYIKAKWCGSYKRTTKSFSPKSVAKNDCRDSKSNQMRSVGFEIVVQNPSAHCRDEMTRKTRMEYGLLAAAFKVQPTEI